ncbi:serine/threonine-protein phosphatase 2A activator-like [Acyrthosiphon pisum]|uniref:Serine/threonine-protein phosphatase 2A activator n=1 Tax=Acyrthosiphon pisum TaxID=7029 RepID=A0A8R2JM06_ACYPI|nr:serine/threonine-protein phosphatase 2A activator-like [Acyrthosiphon pisum]|eukprot:XP_003245316.3 PREDICTED: serine/threonine-protein phosphatase 2A activator-like [Acyrthosiphon pisum]
MQTFEDDADDVEVYADDADAEDCADAVEFPVPVAGASLPVEVVCQRVREPRDMFDWERSEARADLLVFVRHMNDVAKRYPAAAAARRRRRPRPFDDNVDRAMAVLRTVGEWAVKRCGPAGQDDRPESAAERFCHFHSQLRADGRCLLNRTYGGRGRAEYRDVMLPAYLERSFGDPVTMAYGPAHELSFCAFLVSLFKLHHLTWADEPFVVTVIFDKYLDVVDYVIRSYQLYPSSSEYGGNLGNWCLSGYQFVGFLWGSAQLAGSCGDGDGSAPDGIPSLSSPTAVISDAYACRRHRDDYVFAKCMDAVYRRARKDVPLWYHSYQLWNLTALPRWDRVNGCLITAYQRDVLGRFEVIRQLAFCELFKFAQNVRPPGMSFYDIVPAMPPSETAASPTVTDVLSYDDDNDEDEYEDDEKRIIEYGEIEDGEMVDGVTGDVETVEDEGFLL